MADIQAALKYAIGAEEYFNVTNWQLPDADQTTLEEFVDALRQSFVDNIVTNWSNAFSFLGVNIRVFDGGGAFSTFVAPTAGTLSGTSASQIYATQIALMVSLASNTERPNRGRVYFTGLTEGDALNNAWSQPVVDNFVALTQEWVDGLTVTGGEAALLIARPDYSSNVFTAVRGGAAVSSTTKFRTQRGRAA